MNTDTDLFDLDPTEDDLADIAEAEDSADDLYDDYDLDFDSNYRDERYETDGVPSWSAWA